MSDSYFSRKFKEKFNINFSTYLLNIRLEKAKELLKEKKLNIENISEMVGFKDSSYFSKSFKQKYCLIFTFMNYARTLATLVVRPVLIYGYERHIFCLQKI